MLILSVAVFVWIGNGASANEKTKAAELAGRFVSESTDGRDKDIPVIRVHAGEEPVIFTAQFQGWNPTTFAAYVDPYEARLKALKESQAARATEAPKAAVQLKGNVHYTRSCPTPTHHCFVF
jgi:hypothetical protein